MLAAVVESLASYRKCQDRIAASWPDFLARRDERLAQQRRFGTAAEKVAENVLGLATGDVVDALEIPLPAGLLAMSLWLYSGGRANEVRRLSALPAPEPAVALIAAGDSCFFLTLAGGFPWPDQAGPIPDLAGADHQRPAGDDVVIRWHGAGGRAPLPPSALPGGGR